MKRITIYADGTWNTPGNLDNNKVSPTNVFRMFENTIEGPVTNADGSKCEQIFYYGEGVGTGTGKDRKLGGLFGIGIDQNIQEGYRFIVENYEPGDELFLIGFSRGAYTVRSIAGLINNCGILKKQYHQKIERTFFIYKSKKDQHHPTSVECKLFRKHFSHRLDKPAIKFMGVWDTVGSLGVPFKLFSFKGKYRFHDVGLSSEIENAYHAISIDERRVFFRPTLWHQHPKNTDKQLLEQVWFSGAHSDVGGGYSKGDLYQIPLNYLAARAKKHGLQLKETIYMDHEQLKKYALSDRNNPMTDLKYRIFPDYFRSISTDTLKGLSVFNQLGMLFLKLIIKGNERRYADAVTNEFLHASVVYRYKEATEKVKEQMPANLQCVFDDLLEKKRVIGFDPFEKTQVAVS